MKIRFTTFALVVFTCAVWTGALSAQDAQLRYRWNKGEEIRYRLTTQSSSGGDLGIPIPGGASSQLSMNQTTTETIRIVVDDVGTDGKVTLRETIESVRGEIEMNMPGMPLNKTSFDTATGAATDPSGQSRAMAAIVGMPITIVMSPAGVVEKVEGMNRIIEKLTAGLSQPASPAANLLQGFGDEAMTNMFADFLQFPDRVVKVGESWDRQRSMEIPIVGKMTTTEIYTLRSIENGIAHMAIARKINSDSGTNLGPISIRTEIVSSDGELLFDVAKGRMQRMTSDVAQNIIITMTPPPGAPAGFAGPGPMKSTTKIEMELAK